MKRITFLLLILSYISFAQSEAFQQFNYKCDDAIERPYIIYTPPHLDANTPQPLLVYLHGSISNPNLKKDPLQYSKKSKLIEVANKGNFRLLFSFGQKGAGWFDKVGINMILGEINMVKKEYKIDKNKIFLSGFSDGGSGALYLATTNPTPFAGFIAMNGSLNVVSKLTHHKFFLENSMDKPLYIINTKDDMLYDINQINPTITYLKKFNNNVIYRELNGNHEMSYLASEKDAIIDFIKTTTRKPLHKISWESFNTTNNTISGITITQIDTLAKNKAWHQPYNLKVRNNKATFGIKYDYSFIGKGLKIKEFSSDSATAKRMGLQKGDIVMLMEKDTMKNAYSPYFYIHSKKAGEDTKLTIERNGKTKTIKGSFNKGYSYKVFKQDFPTAKFIATFTNGVLSIKTSRIKEIEIDFEKLKVYNLKALEIDGKKVKSNFKNIQKIGI